MSEEPADVEITQLIPPHENSSEAARVRRRLLSDIPSSTARQMAEDFASFQADPSEQFQQRVYRYREMNGRSTGSLTVLGLDFAEVVSLKVA